MMRLLFIQNMRSPYRDVLYAELNRRSEIDVGVFYVEESRAEKSWEFTEHPTWKVYRSPWRKSFGSVEISADVRQACRDFGPTHVVLAGWNQGANWSILAIPRRKRGFRAVAWVESSAVTVNRGGRIATAVRRLFLQRSDAVLVAGRLSEQFVKSLAPSSETIRFPNLVADTTLLQLPAEDRGSIGFVGELSERKGFDVFAGAIPSLSELGPVWIAGDGPLRADAERLAASGACLYHGYMQQDAIRDLYGQTAVVVLPSRRDPWPLVSAEAVVAGCRVVLGPGVGSLPDLSDIAAHSVVGAELNSADLVEAVKQALSLPAPSASARRSLTAQTVVSNLVKDLGV